MSHKKMNPEVKKVWVNELRSGRYKQGDGQLRDGNRFCCLGVLCDLSGAAKWEDAFYDGASQFPSDAIDEWAGLCGREERHLAKMNDDGATFAEIATWIEKHL